MSRQRAPLSPPTLLVGCCLAVVLCCWPGWPVACGQEAAKEANAAAKDARRKTRPAVDPMLKEDTRLGQRITMDLEKPSIRQVLTRLDVATRVSLKVEPRELAEKTRLGKLKVQNAPAWQVMHHVLLTKGVEGRWEKDGEGYRLILLPIATAENPQPSESGEQESPRKTLWWILGIQGGVVCLLAVGLWMRRRRSARPPTEPTA